MPNYSWSEWTFQNFTRVCPPRTSGRRRRLGASYIEQLEMRMLLSGSPPVVAPGQVFDLLASSDVGDVVGTVQASDADSGQTLTYAITAGNNGAFEISPSSGQITVANKSLLNSLSSPVILTVTAGDNVAPVLTGSANITVKLNHAPIFEDATFAVPPPITVGETVGTQTGTDPDPGQTLTYLIIEGNETGAFAIDSTTGKITIANKNSFDQLAFPKTLTVEARDNIAGSAQGKDTAAITVTLDGPPVADGKVVFSFSQDAKTYKIAKNGSPMRLDPKALFDLAPGVSDNFDGAHLAVTLKGVTPRINKGKFFVVSDEPGDGRVSVVGKSILLGDKVIGTFQRGTAGRRSLVITFNDVARADSVEALVRRIGFSSASSLLKISAI